MTAADIPFALRYDVSHARRTLRGQNPALLRDALRMESQRSRPRKRLQTWLLAEIAKANDWTVIEKGHGAGQWGWPPGVAVSDPPQRLG